MDRKTTRLTGNPEYVAQYQALNARESEVSLTPSQVTKRDKLNLQKKNPLDAITKPPKTIDVVEKRSGLQNVSEEHFQQSSMFSQKKSNISVREQQGHNNNQKDNGITTGTTSNIQVNQESKNPPPPSEPIFTENSNPINISNESEKGFCTTCPNCSAKILLVPETSNKSEENSSA
ncbi:uncharacterized protein LOC129911299 [Episyrphus balteatus]|uniref:uncharacterized protein LOC129911299 n=1 Tax=Episyrphus balteatus TaxID=286459 RepID=UPI0024857FB1|nr:uncharacterized protein LOC129911299 [Episyrphus balteatus]